MISGTSTPVLGCFINKMSQWPLLIGRQWRWPGVWLLWLGSAMGFAQVPYPFCQPEVIRYTRQQYGAYNQNWGVAQHGQTRFMYVANSKGLLEFDGSSWRTYTLPKTQVVRSVAVDRQGDVYTGALGEFGYWRPDSMGKLIYHSLRPLINEPAFGSEEIWHIQVTRQGVLFQSFAYMYRYWRGKVQRLYPPGNILFVREVRGRLLLGVLDKGLYELQNNRFVLVAGSEFLGRETVNTLLPADTTGWLIGTERAIYHYDGARFRLFNPALNTLIQQDRLNRGLRLKSGLYAFGTLRNGVLITRPDGQILYHINQKNGLQNSTVLSLCEDVQQNLWVGLDKGIDLINLNSPVRYFTDTEGELGTLYDIARFGDMLYVGTNQGVYARPIFQSDVPFRLVPGTQGQVWSLTVIDNQLFCGHNRGTFELVGMQATQVCGVTGGWVIRRLPNHPDYLIQGTYTRLCLYQKNRVGRWAFAGTITGFSGPVQQLEVDETGAIWVNKAANQGLARLRLSADLRWVVAQSDYTDAFFRGSVGSLCQVQHRIVVTSGSGLRQFDSATNRFRPVPMSLEWLGHSARKLFPQPDSSVVVLHQNGTLRWVKPNQTRDIPVKPDQWVDEYENVVGLDTAYLGVCRENGFELIPRAALPQLADAVPMAPIIRRVTSVGGAAFQQLFRGLNPVPDLSFSYRQHTLQIDFSTPVYTRPLRYSYWLENSMPGWSDYEAMQQKEFSSLPPGRYVFHLRSNLSAAESQFAFEVRPPWYWTTWSKMLYGLLLLGLMNLLYRWHLRRVAVKQNQVREKLEAQLRFQEEHSQREIVMLQKEQLEQGLIQKSEELANSTMLLIRKNELLIQLKSELNRVKEQASQRVPVDSLQRIGALIDTNISTEQDWRLFEANFNKVHEQFLKHLIDNFPDLSQGDLKLAAYLRMNLSTKEIAQLLNITHRSVELKRYRLRKKLNLDGDVNLSEFMIKY